MKEIFTSALIEQRIELIDEYKSLKKKHLCKTKYGHVYITPYNFLKGEKVTIKAALNKTEYFENMLDEINPKIKQRFKILNEYNTGKSFLYLQDNFSVFKTTPAQLLKNKIPGFNSLINKEEYIINKINLLKLNIIVLENNFPILTISYLSDLFKINYYDLIKGIKPTISTCVDPTQMFIKKVRSKNKLYNYDKVIYINQKTKINITCLEHGDFLISPKSHSRGGGCPVCANLKKGIGLNKIRTKSPKSAILYIVKLYNDKESFYKIGITTRKIEERLKTIPYSYEIIKKIKGPIKNITFLENDLLKKHSCYRYIPDNKFGGYTECFNIIKND
jgi:hypothetical protein